MKIHIASGLVQLLFGASIVGWIVLLSRLAHFPFWAAAVGGVLLGWSTVMLGLRLLRREKKR
jgi:hypothetical protein